LAADVHDNPSRRLGLVGITGTNGKTTVAHMLAAITEGTQRSAAVIGTVSANLDDIETSPRTTPEASDLHRLLRRLADRNEVTDVAIEVSSHAMSMGRVTGVEFDLVAFTNLSQDHLDYHRTMDAYYASKASLFRHQWAAEGVVCIDDAWGRRLADESSIPVTTVGTSAEADVVVTHGSDSLTGSTFALAIGDRLLEVKSSLAGRFNVANAAVALTCAYKRGLDLDVAAARLGNMAPISGRYNTLQTDREFSVVVDYAHTPEAIASVIEETRELVAGNIIAMVGAGGDRDREKRPLMGRAVAGADLAVITTDNPRSEDARSIAAEVIDGIPEQTHVVLELDRRLAIRHALSSAVAGDVVLILGKGHETTQELADSVVAFDDSAVVREELARLTEVAK
jgi:UDP-N-acetylmuramoyl-L-alanyl-D-glutamate--2,6-diaminopimelate ligase